MGLRAGQLVSVKWNKIEALFFPSRSKDKANGRDKVPAAEVEGNVPVCACTGRPLGGHVGGGTHPQAWVVESISVKLCATRVGEGAGTGQMWKKK